jgi:cob(I)alamin adenosyltransferase
MLIKRLKKLLRKKNNILNAKRKIKSNVDERIAQATQERGVFVVITGNSKGKSTSGFGIVLRAIGHGGKRMLYNSLKAVTGNAVK